MYSETLMGNGSLQAHGLEDSVYATILDLNKNRAYAIIINDADRSIEIILGDPEIESKLEFKVLGGSHFIIPSNHTGKVMAINYRSEVAEITVIEFSYSLGGYMKNATN